MNITLTMTFSSTQELQSFLNSADMAAPVPATQNTQEAPAKTGEVVQMPASKPAEPAPTPAATAMPVATAAAPVADDFEVKRAALTGRLRTLAEGMDDPSQLGAFINSFGVARFSELPDDQLAGFEQNLNARFGAA